MVSDCAAAGRLRIASVFGMAFEAGISVRAWGRGRRSSFTLHRGRRSCVPVSMLLRKDNKRSSTVSWPACHRCHRRWLAGRQRQAPGSAGGTLSTGVRSRTADLREAWAATVCAVEWPDSRARQRVHRQPCSLHRRRACDHIKQQCGGGLRAVNCG